MMAVIFSVYVINKAGGLIYQHDHTSAKTECEKTLAYPINFVLREMDDRLVVAFGEQDGIKVGHTLIAVNGEVISSRTMPDGRSVLEMLKQEKNFPLTLRFGKPKLSTNERIMLASMFHSLFAIACKLSPVEKSTGIEVLETSSFKLHCFQTHTGVKFLVLTDTKILNMDSFLLKMYEIYADFALKNPFYSLEMPIRCDLFDSNLLRLLEQTERSLTLGSLAP